ncbi:MAG TPA: hypothetical protein VMH39_07520 [Gemmatimonadaceae bacterium]|nr:hypothetical protein [Gemmatimonadaceae bacterium]
MRAKGFGFMGVAVLLVGACGGGSAERPALARLAVSGKQIVNAATGTPVPLRGFVFTAGVWYDVPPGSSMGDLGNLGFMPELTEDLDAALATPSANFGAPMLIGEFTASLAGTRPDILDWTSDLLDYANAHGLSWAYYHYRDTWTGTKYLGVYNGPYGTRTDYSSGDTDILARVQAKLGQ